MDAVALLAGSPLFSGVAAEQLEPLASAMARRRYTRGSYVFHEGDPGRHLFVVAAGLVKISRLGREGAEAVFALLVPGDSFGELALFDPDALRTADAQAVEPTECLTLERTALMSFVGSHPEVMTRVVALLSRHIRRKDEAFAEVGFLDIPGRVARKLLELAAAHGAPSAEGTRIRLRLSQRTLAGMVAASRENVNRALSHFAAEGTIRQEGGYITVVTTAALRRRAGAG